MSDRNACVVLAGKGALVGFLNSHVPEYRMVNMSDCRDLTNLEAYEIEQFPIVGPPKDNIRPNVIKRPSYPYVTRYDVTCIVECTPEATAAYLKWIGKHD